MKYRIEIEKINDGARPWEWRIYEAQDGCAFSAEPSFSGSRPSAQRALDEADVTLGLMSREGPLMPHSRPRVALAANGIVGRKLAEELNRTGPTGEMAFGVTVIRPEAAMMGNRFDTVLLMPPCLETSQTEREMHDRWATEYLPTMLYPGGKIVHLKVSQ
jgi:hypothetical protein